MEDAMKETENKDGDVSADQTGTDAGTSSGADPEAELLRLKAELDKANSDKENYRKGMLKAKAKLKGKSEEDEPEDAADDLDTRIQKTVQEAISQTERGKAQAEYDAAALKNAKELKELKRALASKNASTSVAGGSASGAGQQKSETQNGYWSKEQEAALRERGSKVLKLKGDDLEKFVQKAAENVKRSA